MSVLQRSKTQLWVISAAAALMGIGQNGLLVSLPFLIERSAFGLSTWSMLIALGSFLFLPSAPFWGRYSDRNGPKRVVIQALIGMMISFTLLLVFTMMSESEPTLMTICLFGLILARVIYGCTVAGMVPACQHWAIVLCGEQQRLQAITTISIGLSAGRLIGPLIAIAALKLSPYAPLTLMAVLPIALLLAVVLQPAPSWSGEPHREAGSISWLPNKAFWPYLVSGLLLCMTVALLQYSFTPLVTSVTDWSSAQVSDGIGVLLTISAICTVLVQLFVVRHRIISPKTMYRLGALGVLSGLLLFLLNNVWVYGVGVAIAATGAALLVPAYTSEATDKKSSTPGTAAGYIAMSHTVGYGLAALLAHTGDINPLYPIYLCIVFSLLLVIIACAATRMFAYRVARTSPSISINIPPKG